MLVRPLTRPIVRPLVRGVTEPAFGGRRFTYYVDSVNGDDLNDGLTADTAFATIGKLNTTLSSDYSGQRIGLARGSYWREQIGSSSNASADVVIDAYGTGKLPTFDAADVVPAAAWAKTATYTNVYDLTWAHSASVGSSLSVWEDGARLRWVASVALCDATPGTYYVATVAGSSTALYLHASDSADPDANGKLYEIASRDYGICSGTLGSAWRVSNVRTKRQAHNDGSLVIYAPGSTVSGCVAEDGTKHNLFIGADCAAYDCIAHKADWHDRTNSTLFIAYASDGTGKTAKFVRCIALLDPAVAEIARAAGKGINSFYAHTGGVGAEWDEIAFEDCSASGATQCFGTADAQSSIYLRCAAFEAATGFRVASGFGRLFDCRVIEGTTVGHKEAVVSEAAGVQTDIEGLRHHFSATNSKASVYVSGAGAVMNVTKSVLSRDAAGSGYAHFMRATSGTTLNSSQNIVTGNAVCNGYRAEGAGSADNNVYNPSTIDFRVGATTYNDFAAYRAANPTLDVNSVAADPLLVDPANGDFNVGPASPAIALGAGLERPNITYTAIPSDAEIEAM